MMPSELEQIKQIFQNYEVPLSMEWLESCIEWCKNDNDNLPPNYTIKNLQIIVYDQWLVLDLRDVEIGSLPRNLLLEKKFSLTGVYYLQIMQIIDISKPKLWQLQRIRNNVSKNTEAEHDFGKRVLQLTLTDGVQEIEAMEFKRIACLNINLTPGTKLKIMGPVMVRNGTLMLEPENVKNLGGSVDDLVVQNAAENVLARALGLEENPHPHVIDEQILEVTQTPANTTTQSNAGAFIQNQNTLNQARNNPTQNTARSNQNVAMPSKTNINNKVIRNQEIPPEFQVDDELLRELEEDFEESSVIHFKKSMYTQSSNSTKTTHNVRPTENYNLNLNTNASMQIPVNDKSKRDCTSPDLFDEMEFDDELLNEHLNQIDVESTIPKSTASTKGTGFSTNTTKKLDSLSNNKSCNNTLQDVAISSSDHISEYKDNHDEVITLDDSFGDIDIDSHLDHIDEEMANLPCSTQKVKDFKAKVKSPELKRQTITSKLSLSKPQLSKKLTQSKLTFGTSTISKNAASTSKGAFNVKSNFDDFENPFSIHATSNQKMPPSLVPWGNPDISKKSPNLLSSPRPQTPSTSKMPLKLSNTSKHLPGLLFDEPNLKSSLGPSKINIMSIEKLKKLLPNVSKGKFKIKGKFEIVAEKLKTTDTSFYLVITVFDDTDQLNVKLHSDVVSSFAEITPERLAELRELVIQQDEVAGSEIFQGLKALHSKLLSLDNVLELQITRGETYPEVINVI